MDSFFTWMTWLCGITTFTFFVWHNMLLNFVKLVLTVPYLGKEAFFVKALEDTVDGYFCYRALNCHII